jgi:hypothetical protein
MADKTQRRWGILAFAVLMFIVTVIITNINGAKTSIYLYFWMMVGYYAYKAKLYEIKITMQILIFLNIIVLALVIIFMDGDNPYLVKSGKSDLIFSVLVMLVPKMLLFLYCKNQLETFTEDPNSSEKGQSDITASTVGMATSGSQSAMRANNALSKAPAIPVPSGYKTPVNDGSLRPRSVIYSSDALANVRDQTAPKTNNMVSSSSINTNESIEEGYWATALAEVESNQCRAGVWAKAFSEADGVVTKANAAYMKARVQQMHDLVQAEAEKLASQRRDEAANIKAIASAKQQEIEKVIEHFLHSGTISEVNLKRLIYQQDTSKIIHVRDIIRGNTLLHVCAASGMLDEVRALIVAGASPNEPNNQGLLPYYMTKNADIRSSLG